MRASNTGSQPITSHIRDSMIVTGRHRSRSIEKPSSRRSMPDENDEYYECLTCKLDDVNDDDKCKADDVNDDEIEHDELGQDEKEHDKLGQDEREDRNLEGSEKLDENIIIKVEEIEHYNEIKQEHIENKELEINEFKLECSESIDLKSTINLVPINIKLIPHKFRDVDNVKCMFWTKIAESRRLAISGNNHFAYNSDINKYTRASKSMVNYMTVDSRGVQISIYEDDLGCLTLEYCKSDKGDKMSDGMMYHRQLACASLIVHQNMSYMHVLTADSLRLMSTDEMADRLEGRYKVFEKLSHKKFLTMNHASDMCSDGQSIYVVDEWFENIARVDFQIRVKAWKQVPVKIISPEPKKIDCDCRHSQAKRAKIFMIDGNVVVWNDVHIHMLDKKMNIRSCMYVDRCIHVAPISDGDRSYLAVLSAVDHLSIIAVHYPFTLHTLISRISLSQLIAENHDNQTTDIKRHYDILTHSFIAIIQLKSMTDDRLRLLAYGKHNKIVAMSLRHNTD